MKKNQTIYQQKNGLLTLFDEHNSDLEREVLKGKISKSTHTKYKSIRKKVAGYINHAYQQRDLDFSSIPRSFFNDFHNYLVSEQNLANNTALRYTEMLGKIFQKAEDDGLISRNPRLHYDQKKEEIPINYLNSDDLKKIEQFKPETEKQDIVKDLFLFSCYTGLSYEEIKNVKIENLANSEEGILFLVVSRGSSYDERAIPLLVKAASIIDKYQHKREHINSTLLFPFRLPQSTEEYLRKMADEIEIERELNFSFARYTFMTTVALENEIPISVVDATLGSNSITNTDEYKNLSMIDMIRAMKMVRSKLNNR